MTSSPQQTQPSPVPKLAAVTPLGGEGDPADVTDAKSCLSYLKSREVFLYKMMGDPAHRSMLYFLEVLMNVDSPEGVRLTALSQHFHSRHFTQDMRDAVASSGGLKPFLQKYPSLFRVNGESVSAVSLDGGGGGGIQGALSNISDSASTSAAPTPASQTNSAAAAAAAQAAAAAAAAAASVSRSSQHHHNGGRRDSIGSNNSGRSGSDAAAAAFHSVGCADPLDFARETEAVRFFQTRLSRREDRWVPIKSLAGHLSQAPPEIRAVVGPQAEFARFLARHRHVFEIQGELVGLRDNFAAQCLSGGGGGGGVGGSSSQRHHQQQQQLQSKSRGGGGIGGGLHHSQSARMARPKSLVMPSCSGDQRSSGKSLPTTPTSTGGGSASGGLSSVVGGVSGGPVSMTAAEYKTVMFLRKVLERKGGLLSIPQLFSVLSRSGEGAEQARNLIGWTQIELEEFLRKQSLFFDIHPADGSVSCRRAQKLNIIITGGRRSNRDGKSGGSSISDQTAPRTLTNRRGRVFHCARLWGIIDLGRHEHVFFDKSIFKHVDDLQKHFKVNEVLYFNAILAPKESRAKWRATQVWKEADRAVMERLSGGALAAAAAAAAGKSPLGLEPCLELADDIKFLSDIDETELRRVLQDDVDSRTSSSVPSPVLTPDLSDGKDDLPSAQQQQQFPSSLLPASAGAGGGGGICARCQAPTTPATANGGRKLMISMATQTLSTGEIMATHIFHDP